MRVKSSARSAFLRNLIRNSKRKPRLGEHADDKNHRGIKGLEVFTRNLQQRRGVKTPVVFALACAENSDNQKPGIVFKPLCHRTQQVRMNHQCQEVFYFADGFFADKCGWMPAVGNAQPGLRLLFHIPANFPVVRSDTPPSILIGACLLNHLPSAPSAKDPLSAWLPAPPAIRSLLLPAGKGKAHLLPATCRSGIWRGHSATRHPKSVRDPD